MAPKPGQQRSEPFESDSTDSDDKCNLFQQNPWDTFLGDCSVVDSYLLDKPLWSVKWSLIHYVNVFLRAVGQPAFVNNPFCGAVIFASLFLQDYQVGLGCLLGGSIAVITEMVLRIQPWDLMRNGVAAFNGVLVGTVISCLFYGFYATERTTEMWCFIVGGAFASTYLCNAFGNFLGLVNLPYLALPFNMIIVCSFLTIQPAVSDPSSPLTLDEANQTLIEDDLYNQTLSNTTDLVTFTVSDGVDWVQVGRGILVSMSQVWAINHVPTAIAMNVAVALASPLLFVMSTIGATIGSFLGVALLPEQSLDEVYVGVWGYNALLTMAALSCVFYSFNHASFLLGLTGTVATSVVQYALRVNMTLKNNIPVFTVPMTLVCLVLLLTTNQQGSLHRVEEPSYPEKQSYLWFKRGKLAKTEDDTAGEEP